MADGTTSVNLGPSTSPAAIATELGDVFVNGQTYRSPLADYAQQIFDLGVQFNVDPAFFLGAAYGESQYGLSGFNGYPSSIYNPATGTGTYNWGSITHAAYGGQCNPDANGNCTIGDPRWGQYPSMVAGIQAFFELLTQEYYPLGQTYLNAIWWGIGGSCSPCIDGQHAYGPCSDNHGNCSSLQTVLTVMDRVASSFGPIEPPPPPTVTPIDSSAIAAVVLGLGLLAGAGVLVWSNRA